MKKEARKALAQAKKLEEIPDDSMDEIVRVYKEGMEEAEKMRQLLKPAWFIKDVHPKKKKKAKKRAKKKVKKKNVKKKSRVKRKKRSPSRKKKSL